MDRVKHEKGLRQADIADQLGVKQASISYWKSGKKKPNLDKIDPLCELLGISSIWLLFGEENEPVSDNPLLASLNQLTLTQQENIEAIIKSMSNALSDTEKELLDKLAKLNKLNQGSLLRLADVLIQQQEAQHIAVHTRAVWNIV